MRQVQERGGPSPGLQSAVERGLRSEVSPATLDRWVDALNITTDFATGLFPSVGDGPMPPGLARDIRKSLRMGPALKLSLQTLAGCTLQQIVTRSKSLPEVVLAYVLGISLVDLRQMMEGRMPVPASTMKALASLIGDESLFAPREFPPAEPLEQIFNAAIRNAQAQQGVKGSRKHRSGHPMLID